MEMLKRFVSTKSSFYLLLGISAFILFANLGLPPLWGSEGRWAVIARSMLRSGDLLSPVLGVRSYWDKPLLSYWQVLPLSYINGDVSEFTARFPSVVWSVVMLILTYRLAKRWFGEQTALLSVGILATSFDFVFYGRDAQVEMTNAAMMLLCLWYFLKHKSDHTHTWVYVLSILMALGSNMKGLILYAVPIFGIVLLSVIKREWSWIPPLRILITAGLLSLAVFLALPAAASIHSATWEPLHLVWRENVLRFFGRYDHKDPFYTYFVKIFYLAAPWSLLLPVAIIHCLQGVRRRVSQIPEALILFGAIFLFFTLSGSRRSYYLLPILPFVAILVASVLREFAVGTLGRAYSRRGEGGRGFVGARPDRFPWSFLCAPAVFSCKDRHPLVCVRVAGTAGCHHDCKHDEEIRLGDGWICVCGLAHLCDRCNPSDRRGTKSKNKGR